MTNGMLRKPGECVRAITLVTVALIVAVTAAAPPPARAQEPSMAAHQASMADLVEQAGPSVVNVHTKGMRRDDRSWFFGNPFGVREWTSLGSGFVVDPDGLIVTNNHVIHDATSIRIGLQDGRIFDAAVVGTDPATDLALLYIDATDLPALQLGDSTALRVGEQVFAVGNPYGYDHTVTAGIISAKYRNLGLGPYDDFLQTDASINPGNSGGPLLDMTGHVVGVNTVTHGSGEGLGWAVPVDMLAAVLPRLRAGGTVVRGWPGVRLADSEDGPVVVQIYPSGPAAKGKLKADDIVTEAAGRPVRNVESWTRALGSSFPGDMVELKVRRNDKTLDVLLEVVDYEAWSTSHGGAPVEVTGLGITVRPTPPDRQIDIGLESGVGLEIVEVTGPPATHLFAAGDILVQFGGVDVGDVKALAPLAADAIERHRIDAVVFRGSVPVRVRFQW
jgi:serine protease Do